MEIRKVSFANNQYYHIFNREVDKRKKFTNTNYLYYFFNSLSKFNTIENTKSINFKFNNEDNKLVEIIAYCLLPNHFYLLLRQKTNNGIIKFIHKLSTSYTTFFNKIKKRTGSLFQGRFKATHISGDYSLSNVATYVNLNYKHHNIDPKKQLVKSSIFEYLNKELGHKICNVEDINRIIAESSGINNYKNYMKNVSIAFANNKGIELKKMILSFKEA